MKDASIIIHTDGGARGNPGPSACAFVAEEAGDIIYKGSKFLGINTNNFAEYSAFVLALQWLSKNSNIYSDREIIFYSDSELVVRQLAGIYKIKNEKLRTLNQKIVELVETNNFKISYKNILRSKNKIADQLVNDELDKN
jgi:ribonuclease HI